MLTHTSSVECKKVVSDILAETEFLADIKSAGKMTHFSYSASLNSKYLYFYGTNKTLKTMKYKGNLCTKLLLLQNDENTLTTFLHSTDDIQYRVKEHFPYFVNSTGDHFVKGKFRTGYVYKQFNNLLLNSKFYVFTKQCMYIVTGHAFRICSIK